MVDPATGRRMPSAQEIHRLTSQADDIPVEDFADHESLVASWNQGAPPPPPSAPPRDWGDMVYDHGTGEGPSLIHQSARAVKTAQRQGVVNDAYQYGQQYLNNPLAGKGRGRMATQFWEAPLGGHVRRGLQGQEVFGHTIDAGQAHMAEQGLAGLAAVGIGVPAFLSAVQQLTTPADQNTIPL
jgi:hypothetical protein